MRGEYGEVGVAARGDGERVRGRVSPSLGRAVTCSLSTFQFSSPLVLYSAGALNPIID